MPMCTVDGCKERSPKSSYGFFTFPVADQALCKEWVRRTGQPYGAFSVMFGKICSKHFQHSDLIVKKHRLEKIKGCLPMLHLPPEVIISADIIDNNTTTDDVETTTDVDFIATSENMSTVEQNNIRLLEVELLETTTVESVGNLTENLNVPICEHDYTTLMDMDVNNIEFATEQHKIVTVEETHQPMDTSVQMFVHQPVIIAAQPESIHNAQSPPLPPPETVKAKTIRLAIDKKCPAPRRRKSTTTKTPKSVHQTDYCRLCLNETDKSIGLLDKFQSCRIGTKLNVQQAILSLLKINVNARLL